MKDSIEGLNVYMFNFIISLKRHIYKLVVNLDERSEKFSWMSHYNNADLTADQFDFLPIKFGIICLIKV